MLKLYQISFLSKKNLATFGPLSHQSQAPRSEAPPASFSFYRRHPSLAITLPFTLKFSLPHKPEPPRSSSLLGSSNLLPFSLTHLKQTKKVTKRLLERCDTGGGQGSFLAWSGSGGQRCCNGDLGLCRLVLNWVLFSGSPPQIEIRWQYLGLFRWSWVFGLLMMVADWME